MNEINHFADRKAIFDYLSEKISHYTPDDVVMLTGTTASGKSDLALKLCEHFSLEVISCDSVQIYRGFDIGSAKISKADQARVKHHMIDIVEATQDFTVADYCQHARNLIKRNQEQKKLSFFCGGTMQYLSALEKELNFPEKAFNSPDISEKVSTFFSENDQLEAYSKLQQLDPAAAAKISVNDKRRIRRFWEIYFATGYIKSTYDKMALGKTVMFPNATQGAKTLSKNLKYHIFFLTFSDRQKTYERIDQRTLRMFNQGLLAEVAYLLEKYNGNAGLKAFNSIGYKQSVDCLLRGTDLSAAIADTQMSTRHYAKRQLTWFRALPSVNWLLCE